MPNLIVVLCARQPLISLVQQRSSEKNEQFRAPQGAVWHAMPQIGRWSEPLPSRITKAKRGSARDYPQQKRIVGMLLSSVVLADILFPVPSSGNQA